MVRSCLLAVSLLAASSNAELAGRISSPTGASVEGAVVVNLRLIGLGRYTKSAANGTFRLASGAAPLLLVDHPRFEPTIQVVAPEDSNIEIKLKNRVSEAERIVPLCVDTPRGATALLSLKFDLRGAKVKVGRDADYVRKDVFYGKRSKHHMEIWDGSLVTLGYPSDFWLGSSTAFTIVRWTCGDRSRQGLDVCGRSPEGALSRWIGFRGSFASYESVSPGAARFFDKIIDKMCCQ